MYIALDEWDTAALVWEQVLVIGRWMLQTANNVIWEMQSLINVGVLALLMDIGQHISILL